MNIADEFSIKVLTAQIVFYSLATVVVLSFYFQMKLFIFLKTKIFGSRSFHHPSKYWDFEDLAISITVSLIFNGLLLLCWRF